MPAVPHTFHSSIKSLSVSYRQEHSEEWILAENELPSTTSNFTLLDLGPGHKYEVRVTAHPENGTFEVPSAPLVISTIYPGKIKGNEILNKFHIHIHDVFWTLAV